MKLETLQRWVFGGACLFSSSLALAVLAGNTERFAAYLPDDAYYYLQVAHTYARTGVSSFDRGVSINTGYHLAWFYWLVGLAKLLPQKAHFAAAAVGSSVLFSLATVGLAALSLWRRPAWLLALALTVTGYAYVNGQHAALEWPFAVGASVLAYRVVGETSRAALVGLFVIGLFGSLARTDFAGVPTCLLFAALVLSWRRGNRAYVRPAVSLWLGALLGFALVVLYNWELTGDWLSSSARAKQAWSRAYSPNPVPAVFQFARALAYLPPLPYTGNPELRERAIRWGGVALAFALVLGAAAWVWLRRRAGRHLVSETVPGLALAFESLSIARWSDMQVFFTCAAASTLFAYLGLYTLGPAGMQSWYSAHAVVPLTLGAGALIHVATAWCRKLARPGSSLGFVPSSVVLAVIVGNAALALATRPSYEHQAALVAVGRAVERAAQRGLFEPPLAAADVGIIGFYSGGLVVNTDGLVNAEVARTPLERLPCYLYARGLRHVSGFGSAAEGVAPVPWERISALRTVTTELGAFAYHEVDLEAVERLYRCTDSTSP